MARSNATKQSNVELASAEKMDCFASFAMTGMLAAFAAEREEGGSTNLALPTTPHLLPNDGVQR